MAAAALKISHQIDTMGKRVESLEANSLEKEIGTPHKGERNQCKRNRRSLNKNKVDKVHVIGKSVNIVGINATGITSKIQAFDKVLFDTHPSVFYATGNKKKTACPKNEC